MPVAAAARPRKMLPPPTTMPISTPSWWRWATCRATKAQNSGSTPYGRFPSSASPESLSRIRRDRVGVDIVCAHSGDLDRQVADELLELLVAGHEVAFAVDLDQHPDAAARVDVAADEALAGLPAGALGGSRLAAFAQNADGLLHVAFTLFKGALAVHEARQRALAQLLDHPRGA